ncbi:MAG: methylated-DNA-protein-cysteine methyltransferase related protein [Acidimicrobiaceae bacterium]|nr:methylated-DNA-protein-cysteine methyltransferase related protein [Acidimicrobiaceae bacterium]
MPACSPYAPPTPAPALPPDFRSRVVAVVAGLAPGEVVSYGDVAAEAGYPGAARGVGAVLAHSDGLPWWRVVMSTGHLAPGKEVEQARRLRAEGVPVARGRVQRPRSGSQR